MDLTLTKPLCSTQYYNMEERYEQILSQLTEEERDIVKFFNERELLKVKCQLLDNVQTETQKELLKVQTELQKVQCQNQVLQTETEQELLKVIKETEQELLKEQSKSKVLQVKYETMKETLAQANWEKIENSNIDDVRGLIHSFERGRLYYFGKRNKHYDVFIEKNEQELKEWGLSVDVFKKIFPIFYDKVCNSAHPIFKSTNICVINNCLEESEIKILGFLWEKYPLPKSHLHVKLSDKQYNVFEVYRVSHDVRSSLHVRIGEVKRS
ncbi:hypothetical protein RI129_006525 [Pyrocoelia pectoralis]|uniref:Uncharacterized protein n=1 Tax=Pyrocoelia pectoralis TaxID=417401 RepID=A0AAN7VBE8_9COLE